MATDSIEIKSPWDGALVGRVRPASREDVDRAIAAAVRAFARLRGMAAFEREAVLSRAAAAIEARAAEFATLIARECGKPIRDARAEVARAVTTFRLGAEEAKRVNGEAIPLDIAERGRGRLGIARRVPRGPIAAITPFNFPLNLAAHKIAPAIACGCPVVLKPAPQAPLSAIELGRTLGEAGLFEGALSVLPGGAAIGEALVEDERLKLVSFTGSDRVGWEIKRRAGKKPTILELGGNAAAIVCADTDLDEAAEKCVFGAFAYAGQVCISIQRIFVERAARDRFVERLLDRTRRLVVGDPLDERTDMGPLIDERSAERIAGWIEEAIALGGRALCGGGRHPENPRVVLPTILERVPPGAKVACEEAFGPVATLDVFDRFEDALARVNESRFGLQASIFTNDLGRVQRAFERLDVGALIVGDAPNFRLDHMPYGGTKDSGLGREGVRYAIEEMTELRLLVLPPVPRQ
jgi:glyceraldehyde-3-phosphate dehydrogenase (NADP+)